MKGSALAMNMIYILFVCSFLWLLAIFIVNLTQTGRTQVWLCGLLRFLMLFSILVIRALVQIGFLSMDGVTFRTMALFFTALAISHFFASDFTKYVKDNTLSAAKNAIVNASTTLLLLGFIIFLTTRT